MLTNLRSNAVHGNTLIQRVFFGIALVYAAMGAMVGSSVVSPRVVSGLMPSLVLLAACLSPLAVMLALTAVWADRLDRAERRTLLLAAGAAALLLLPLLSSVFPCSAR